MFTRMKLKMVVLGIMAAAFLASGLEAAALKNAPLNPPLCTGSGPNCTDNGCTDGGGACGSLTQGGTCICFNN